MVIWDYEFKNPHLIRSLQSICAQLNGKMCVDVTEQAIEIDESLEAVTVYLGENTTLDLQFVHIGHRTSKLEQLKQPTL
jgi:hypothetical protein